MPSNTDWFRDAQWGVFCHYLTPKETAPAQWNAQVESFDVDGLARQVQAVGAGYMMLTIGQNSGHFCSPNATYDSLTGITPSKLSRRDLVADLAAAMEARGLRLMVYLPAGAPAEDAVACDKLQWQWGYRGAWPACHGGPMTGNRLAEFQRKWQSVIREWSRRWGRRVHGWWIDGCYFADDMYNSPDEPNWASFVAALKAGNDRSIVAFNPGVKVPVAKHCPIEDYTAGELAGDLPVGAWGGTAECPLAPIPGRIDGAQYHVLCFLGRWWGAAPPRFPTELAAGYTRYVTAHGGTVSWDVPISPGGAIPQPFVDQLAAIGKAAASK